LLYRLLYGAGDIHNREEIMTDHDNDHPRKRQADAMAAAQAWGLVVHACAIHHGHPHAEQMMANDIAELESAGAMELVLVAHGDELDARAGHRLVIDALSRRIQPGEHVARTVAAVLAEVIDHDGERALREQRACTVCAEFWGVVCDAFERLGDE
jgi:hypothetical protein